MAYGDGGKPYLRPDGLWVARFEAGFTATGGRRRKTISAKTEAECKRRLRDAVREYRETGATSIDPKTNLKKWCDQWSEAQKLRARPRVQETDAYTIRKWIIPIIGHKRLTDLTPADLRKIDAAVLAAGRSPSTAANVRAKLLTILRDAKREGHTIPDPVFLTEKPARAESDRTSLTVGQAAVAIVTAQNPDSWPTLTDPTPHHDHGGPVAGRNRTSGQRAAVTQYRQAQRRRDHALTTSPARWMIGLLQALRQGETLGLQWDHIDFVHHTINIDRELVQVNAQDYVIPAHQWHTHLQPGYVLMRPKTKTGIRRIPMISAVETALIDWRGKCPSSPHNLVFPRPDGTPQSPVLDRLAWQGIQDAADIRKPDGTYFVVHEMRHTTVSLLLAAGVDPAVIIEIVGHATFASSQPYAHRLRENTQARDALEKVAALLQIEN